MTITTEPLRLYPTATGNELRLRVLRKTEVADGVVTLDLAHPEGLRLPDWAPGAHIDLHLPNGLTRQYSLCGDRFDTNSYRVGVLREPASRGGSAYVHEELAEGDAVVVGGPRNNFQLAPADAYLFIAGGIGITPLLPMIRQAEMLEVPWRLVYGGRTRRSMAFVDDLARYGDRVHVRPQDEYGLLDLEAALGAAGERTKVYVCGPGSLLDAVEQRCAGWVRGRLRTERFVAKDAVPVRSAAFTVELARSGHEVVVTPDVSILEAIGRAGVSILSSCQRGVCGTCETGVLAGDPDHRDTLLDDAERDAGDCMFICVSRSRGERLVLDL